MGGRGVRSGHAGHVAAAAAGLRPLSSVPAVGFDQGALGYPDALGLNGCSGEPASGDVPVVAPVPVAAAEFAKLARPVGVRPRGQQHIVHVKAGRWTERHCRR
jgi:hypothetical protein